MAPQANILLVESTTNEDGDMWAAVDYARQQPGVVAVSMSWGEDEYAGESEADAHLVTPVGHGGVTFLAASGDDGGQPVSPSTSPNAVAVGGRRWSPATATASTTPPRSPGSAAAAASAAT